MDVINSGVNTIVQELGFSTRRKLVLEYHEANGIENNFVNTKNILT
jgi:hypothetical protein